MVSVPPPSSAVSPAAGASWLSVGSCPAKIACCRASSSDVPSDTKASSSLSSASARPNTSSSIEVGTLSANNKSVPSVNVIVIVPPAIETNSSPG